MKELSVVLLNKLNRKFYSIRIGDWLKIKTQISSNKSVYLLGRKYFFNSNHYPRNMESTDDAAPRCHCRRQLCQSDGEERIHDGLRQSVLVHVSRELQISTLSENSHKFRTGCVTII